MPTVSEFLENNQSGVPPALQSIIDKVTGYANQRIGGAMGQTAAQGAALKGVMGQVGGLVEQGRTEEGLNKRFGIAQAKATNQFDTTQKLEQDKFGLEKEKFGVTQKVISPYLQGQITSGFGMGSQPEQPKEKYPGYSNLLKIW